MLPPRQAGIYRIAQAEVAYDVPLLGLIAGEGARRHHDELHAGRFPGATGQPARDEHRREGHGLQTTDARRKRQRSHHVPTPRSSCAPLITILA